jgi:hypothetical protein
VDSDAAFALQHWRLSASVTEILSRDLEMLARLTQERRKPCFPRYYCPIEIEVLHDHELYIQIKNGHITYLRYCSPRYVPTFVEVTFDRQLAMFLVKGEVVVDRTPTMITLTQLVTNLKQSP